MENKKTYQRYTAIKITIKELLEGEYKQENEETPNYLLTVDQRKIFRLNLMATILDKEVQGNVTNFFLDDGSSQINLRFFETNTILDKLKIGDIVLVIGKLRIYNQEKYISPEIVKKIDSGWLKVRALEIKKNVKQEPVAIKEEIKEQNEIIEDIEEEKPNKEIEILPIQKITSLIKELDQGEGVMVEEIISKSSVNDTEQLLEKMLENGEIFQNSPGKVKVL